MFDNIPSSPPTNSIDKNSTPDVDADLKNLNQDKNFPFKKIEHTVSMPTKPFSNTEDIFSTTEKGIGGQISRPLMPFNAQSVNNPAVSTMFKNNNYTEPGGLIMKTGAPTGGAGIKKSLTVLLIILTLAILALAGWWAYGKFFVDKLNNRNLPNTVDFNSVLKNLNDDLQRNTVQPAMDRNSKQLEENQNTFMPGVNTSTLPVAIKDSDGDGLTDLEEDSLGTNPNKVDTDFDGLSDYDEIKVYFTNPLKADSDNDGYMDGLEVENGYDPLGPGKLIN